jgi:hypothetical protein
MVLLVNLVHLNREIADPKKECQRCGGDGFVDNNRVDGMTETSLFEACPVCRGKGETDLPHCEECGGNGLYFPEGSGWSDCAKCKGKGYFYEPLLPPEAVALLPGIPDSEDTEVKGIYLLKYRLFIPGTFWNYFVAAGSGEDLWGLYTDSSETRGLDVEWTGTTLDRLRCFHENGKFVEWDKEFKPYQFEA